MLPRSSPAAFFCFADFSRAFRSAFFQSEFSADFSSHIGAEVHTMNHTRRSGIRIRRKKMCRNSNINRRCRGSQRSGEIRFYPPICPPPPCPPRPCPPPPCPPGPRPWPPGPRPVPPRPRPWPPYWDDYDTDDIDLWPTFPSDGTEISDAGAMGAPWDM